LGFNFTLGKTKRESVSSLLFTFSRRLGLAGFFVLPAGPDGGFPLKTGIKLRN